MGDECIQDQVSTRSGSSLITDHASRSLVVLEHDAFENIRHVFAAIGPRLEGFVDLLPLNDGDRIGFFFKQS